jgi:hypothetical protein
MAICKCEVGLGNTGTPACAPIASVLRKIVLVPTYDSTGAKNSIDLTATLDAAYLTARINDTDSTKRWFPLPDFENVTSERAESTFEEAPSGTRAFVRQGSRTLTGEIWGKEALPTLIGKIKEARCVSVSAFIIDGDGKVIGNGDAKSPDILYPIQLDAQSIDAIWMAATDGTTQKINVTFTFSDSEKDEDIYLIQPDVDFTFDALAAKGLLDICVAYSSISTTGFEAVLFNEYGLRKSLKDVGLVIGDFSLYNDTTAASVTITSVTESPDGTYTFVIPAQTSADSMTLTPSKDGRDYADVVATAIVIP